jgi:lipase chaperone LimK
MKLHRIGLVAASLASIFTVVVLPATPASASGPCSANPSTPTMIDPQIYEMDAASKTVCNQEFALVQAEAKLQRYELEWVEDAYGHQEQKNASWVWADAFLPCKDQGEPTFRTSGYAKGIAAVGYMAEDGWNNSGYNKFNCGYVPIPSGIGGLKP